MTDIDDELKIYRLRYRTHWRSRRDWYWFYRLCQEVWELFWALLGLHKHTPDVELKQIAGICTNWLEKRIDERNFKKDHSSLVGILILISVISTILLSLVGSVIYAKMIMR